MKHSSLTTFVWTSCWLILACGLDGNVTARQTGNGLPQTTAKSEVRVALVIGNSDYGKQHLATTGHDARAVAALLRELGFAVTLRENASQAEFRGLLSTFGAQTRQGSVGLFYFAGLAAQFNGSNWLLPARTKFKNPAQLRTAAIALDEVQAAMTAHVNLLLLDASRIHPLLRSQPRGLASLSAPAATLIAYAAQPGATTRERPGQPHSPYIASLLQHLRTPGLALTTLFDRVRADVASATKNRQTPWESSGLRGEFSLNPVPQAVAAVTPPENDELADWQAIASSTDLTDFQTYLAKYPQGIYADSARVKLQQLTQKEEPAVATVKEEPTVTTIEPANIAASLPEASPKSPQILTTESEAKAESEKAPGPAATLTGNRSGTSAAQTRVERLFYDACYVQKNEPVCCQLAVDLISKFPDTIYGLEARNRTRECQLKSAWESFQAALQDYYASALDSAKLEKVYAAGEAFLRLRPDYPYVVAQMALVGSAAALGELYRNHEKVKGYAEKALKVFGPTQTPSLEIMTQQDWDKMRETILAYQNQYLGYYYFLKETAAAEEQALGYLAKSIQVKGQLNQYLGWRDPTNYWLRSEIYGREYGRLSKQHAALTAEQKESDAGKTLLALINQVVDKLIVEKARTVAVANRPEYKAYRDAALNSLQSLWKERHGSLAGMEEFIKRYEKDPSAA